MGSLSEGQQGKRLMAVVVDERARHTPDRVYAITPKTHDINDGYGETTYGQVARAVDKLSWWLDAQLGKCTDPEDFEMIAYIGPRDLRYTFIVLAAMKTHRQVLLPLSQNSFEAHLELVNRTQTKALVGATGTTAVWEKIMETKPDVRMIMIPDLEDLLDSEPVKHYPYEKTWEEAKNDPIHVNHTSGTTGMPKPIAWTNGIAATIDLDRYSTSLGRKTALGMLEKQKFVSPMPPEWLGGLFMTLHFPIFLELVPVLMPVDAPHPMTAEYMDRVHRIAPEGLDGGLYVPDTLKQLSKTPAYLDYMKQYQLICFAGAALDKSVGDTLAKFAKVQSLMGSTEAGAYPMIEADREDWDFYGVDVEHDCGVRMAHYQDDLYELTIERVPGREVYQNIFKIHPQDEVHHTKDLFRQHPTKKGLWRPAGRTDDFVKLSSLTKFNATHVESVIDRHLLIRDAVVGGEGLDIPFVIVHLVDGQAGKERRAVLDEIWPAFEQANEHFAKDIQLRKETVLFTKPEKPFRKAGKGTLNRREIVADYAEEIRQMYEALGFEL